MIPRILVGVSPRVVDGRLKGGGVSLVIQPLESSPLAYEAEEDRAMSESTTDIRIVPLSRGQDVLTAVLREGARRMLAQAVEAEVAAWVRTAGRVRSRGGRTTGTGRA
jgi:hypothetical protein